MNYQLLKCCMFLCFVFANNLHGNGEVVTDEENLGLVFERKAMKILGAKDVEKKTGLAQDLNNVILRWYPSVVLNPICSADKVTTEVDKIMLKCWYTTLIMEAKKILSVSIEDRDSFDLLVSNRLASACLAYPVVFHDELGEDLAFLELMCMYYKLNPSKVIHVLKDRVEHLPDNRRLVVLIILAKFIGGEYSKRLDSYPDHTKTRLSIAFDALSK